jgi:hypothetical protein
MERKQENNVTSVKNVNLWKSNSGLVLLNLKFETTHILSPGSKAVLFRLAEFLLEALYVDTVNIMVEWTPVINWLLARKV